MAHRSGNVIYPLVVRVAPSSRPAIPPLSRVWLARAAPVSKSGGPQRAVVSYPPPRKVRAENPRILSYWAICRQSLPCAAAHGSCLPPLLATAQERGGGKRLLKKGAIVGIFFYLHFASALFFGFPQFAFFLVFLY